MDISKELQEIENDLMTLTAIDYNVRSHLGISEEERYIQRIDGKIFKFDDQGPNTTPIGEVRAYKILLGEARNNNQNIHSLWDIDGEVYALSEKFWDYENDDLNKKILSQFDDVYGGSDILILDYIELIPEYRGKELGKYIIKDLYNNFISGASVFIVNLDEKYSVGKPRHKIVAYLNLMGFEIIPSLCNDLMFLSSALINPAFKTIDLE